MFLDFVLRARILCKFFKSFCEIRLRQYYCLHFPSFPATNQIPVFFIFYLTSFNYAVVYHYDCLLE